MYRLCLMMFLQYAVWGIWMPILPRYLKGELGFAGGEVAWIAAVAAAIGAVAAPFLGGQLADRYFATQKYLSAALMLGGIVNFLLADQTTFEAWLVLSVIYAVLYMPTLGLTNSLAMSHLEDPRRQFPLVRVWGTIGWIAAGWLFSMIWLKTDVRFDPLPPFFAGDDPPDAGARIADAFRASGVLSILYGLYCLTLPDTPPNPNAAKRFALSEVAAVFARPSILVLLFVSVLLAATHKLYFLQTSTFFKEALGLSDASILPAMSIGQFAEIIVMALLGKMLAAWGFRAVLSIGAACYCLRFLIFGTVELPNELIIASQFLHGFCFACSFAGAFIYIDRIAPRDARHSAQTAFILVMLGAGPILGGYLSGELQKRFSHEGVVNYTGVWYTAAAIAGICTVILFALFRDETADASPAA